MAKIQDHIHIGFTKAVSGEKAPTTLFKTVDLAPSYEGFFDFKRSLQGQPRIHVLTNEQGIPAVYRDYQHIIKLYQDETQTGYEKYEALTQMLYQNIYYVPHYHADNGQDHTDNVMVCVLAEVRIAEALDKYLHNIHVKIIVKDASQYGYGTGNTLSTIVPSVGVGVGSMYLNDLADVNAIPSSNTYLGWDVTNQRWEAKTVASGGGATNLDGLTDVTITTPTTNHVLQYNGSAWINRTLTAAGIAASSHTHDASAVTYTPTVLNDWNSNADPGNVNNALDQLANRVKNTIDATNAEGVAYNPTTSADWDATIPDDVEAALDQIADRMRAVEAVSSLPDASAITYSPATVTDWNSNADPGNVDGALDQIAERLTVVESVGGVDTFTRFDPDAPSGYVDTHEDMFQAPVGDSYDTGKWDHHVSKTFSNTPTIYDFGLSLTAPSADLSQPVFAALHQNFTLATSDTQIIAACISGGNLNNLQRNNIFGIFVADNMVAATPPTSTQKSILFFGIDESWNTTTQRHVANIVFRRYGSAGGVNVLQLEQEYAAYPCDPLNPPRYLVLAVTYNSSGNEFVTGYFSYDGITWKTSSNMTVSMAFMTTNTFIGGIMAITPPVSGAWQGTALCKWFKTEYRFAANADAWNYNFIGQYTNVIQNGEEL